MPHDSNIPPKPIPLVVLPENIPTDLRAFDQWLIWNYAWKPVEAYFDKPPLDANKSGNLGSSTKSSTWATFTKALNSYQLGHYDGIGIALTDKNGIVGFDLDDCRNPETSDIAPWAKKIVEQVPTYWEISPSGTGLRGLGYGRKPGSRCRTGDFELYSHGRYLCLTGHHLDGTPQTIQPVQDAIDAVYAEMFPTQERQTSSNGHSPRADDTAILDALRRYKNGAKFCRLFDDGDISEYRGDHSVADQGLCRLIAFRTQDPEQVDRLFRLSALNRQKWESRDDYRDRTIARAITHVKDRYQGVSVESSNGQPHDNASDEQHASSNGADQQEKKSDKPVIQLSTNMTAVVSRMQAIIRQHPSGPFLYQRAHQLSVITQGAKPPKWLDRAPDAPLIHPADKAFIRELASYAANWVKWDGRKKAEVNTLPPPWAIETLMARPKWSFPPLEGIICAPTLRPDGSVLHTSGYDQDTGLYLYLDQMTFPAIPEHPSLDDARLCVQLLLDVFRDFPFLAAHHQSAALSAVLSLVARFTIQGKVPFFALRSTTRGAGKGLLIDAISVIATGRHAPRWAQTLDEEEERKRLMTIAMSGDAALHIDNITHPLGSGPLDMVMTAEAITERVMATHAERTAPIKAVFFGSGNNMVFQSDMARRVVPIDLAPTQERPDERDNFTHHPLLAWVREQRPKLVMAALTIIKAYIEAARPKQANIKPFGSYEEWSDLIRQSLIWAGEPDPCAGRGDIEAESDPKYEMQKVVLTAWFDRYGEATKTLKEVKDDIDNHTIRELDDHDKPTGRWIVDPGWRDLQSALLGLTKRGHDLDLRALGYAFRSWQGRVLANLQLHKAGEDRLGTHQWQVKKIGR
jgi:hypothetical protein